MNRFDVPNPLGPVRPLDDYIGAWWHAKHRRWGGRAVVGVDMDHTRHRIVVRWHYTKTRYCFTN